MDLKMKSKASVGVYRRQGRVITDHVAEGPNWVLVAGGILLSTLSVRLGCTLKQLFVTKQQDPCAKAKRRPGACELAALQPLQF